MNAKEIRDLCGKITISDKEYLLIEEKVLQSLLDNSSENVWAFYFNANTWECCAAVMSLHRTEKNAQMALEFHKAEWLESEGLSIPDKSVWWGVGNIKIND